MALLTFTIIEAPDHGWGSPRTVAGFATSAALLACFVAWEHRTPEPMLDIGLFRHLRFTAASGSVTVVFFSIAGFIFLITQYFQFFKGFGPLSTGIHLLPVATSVGVMSVVGTKLAVRYGTKLVVSTGLLFLTVFFVWVSTVSTSTSYLEIAGQMVLGGSGMGLTSAPATEAIMGVVPRAKAGVGSAVNDATRLLGATLGVAVIGSVYASLYASRLTSDLPSQLPHGLSTQAHDSVGAALQVAGGIGAHGRASLSGAVHSAAEGAFFHGFAAGCLVAAAVSAAGLVMAMALLPAQPLAGEEERVLAFPATGAAAAKR